MAITRGYRLVATHFRIGTRSSIEPTGLPGEYVTTVEMRRTALGSVGEMVASFTRYHDGGDWYLGHDAWHTGAPVNASLYAGRGVDHTDVLAMKDAVALAIDIRDEEVKAGPYQAFTRARDRILAIRKAEEEAKA